MTNCVQVCRAFTCGRCVKYHDDSLPAGHPRKCSESHAVPKKEIKCCSTLLPGQETNTTRRNSPSAAFFSDDNRRALSFEDAFDGEANVLPRRLRSCFNWKGEPTGDHLHAVPRGEWNVEGLLLPVDAASPRGAWKTPLPIHMIRSRPISPFGFQ